MRHVLTLAASLAALVAVGFLPWYAPTGFAASRERIDGFGEPLPWLLPLALGVGAVILVDGLVSASGRSVLPPLGSLDRDRVRTSLGLTVLAFVGYKFLFKREDADVGLFIGLGLAAFIAYQAYAIGFVAGSRASETSSGHPGTGGDGS